MKRRILASLWIIAALAFLLPAQINAQPVCIPRAEGIPGNSTPPNWFDLTQTSAYFKKLHDPRWVGAGAITYGDGTNTQAEFRALHGDGKANLYLSWRVFLAPAEEATQNHLYVGFPRPAGNPMIIHVSLNTLSPLEADDTQALEVRELLPTGRLGPVIPTPASLSGTMRVWINNPTTKSFAVQMRVPVSLIAMVGDTFPMWFELLAGTPDPTPPLHVFNFNWPRDISGEITPPTGFGDTDHFPLIGAWNSFHLSNFPGDPSCAGGVSLDVYQIGAHHPGSPPTTPDSRILYRTSGSPLPVNQMFARPKNDTGATIATDDLRATFSLANWGSVIGDETSASWTQIPIPASVDGTVGNAGPILNGTLAGASNEIHFNWILGPADYAPYEAGTRNRDNCLLVTLTSRTGLTFVNNSIRRNMDFESASTMVRTGEININPLSTAGREIFLYIEALNMPARVTEPLPNTHSDVPYTQSDVPRYQGHQPETMTPVQLSEAAANGQLTDAQMDQLLPTYRIHVFHSTDGDGTIHPDGTPKRLLRPQAGFGYRVVHNGDLLGWVHNTVCLDCTLEKLAPNFYRIANIPSNGLVHVRTTIEAIEPGGSSDSRYRFFFDLGPNFPGDGFSNLVEGQWSANVGVEKRFQPNLSVEAIAGYHLFEAEADGFEGRFEFCSHIEQFSANMKRYFGPGPLHWFMNAGGGAYHLDPDDTWEWGVNAGGGLLFDINSHWGLEFAVNRHRVNSSPDDLDWSTLQAGLRLSF